MTPTPKAMDSPAEPVVWTMLCSRMVASRTPNFDRSRNSVIEITATGIDALTVSPTFRTRYSDEAPKMMPRIVPTSDRTYRHFRESRIGGDIGPMGERSLFHGGLAYSRNRISDWLLQQNQETPEQRDGLAHGKMVMTAGKPSHGANIRQAGSQQSGTGRRNDLAFLSVNEVHGSMQVAQRHYVVHARAVPSALIQARDVLVELPDPPIIILADGVAAHVPQGGGGCGFDRPQQEPLQDRLRIGIALLWSPVLIEATYRIIFRPKPGIHNYGAGEILWLPRAGVQQDTSTEAVTDGGASLDPQRFDETGDFLFEYRVGIVRAIFTVAHATEVRDDDAIVLCQPGSHEIPPVCVGKEPMQQQKGGCAGRSRPLQVVHADARHRCMS